MFNFGSGYKTKLFKVLINFLFLGFGILFMYLAFKDQSWEEIYNSIKNANLWIMIPIVIFNIVGSTLRAIRWQALIKPIEGKPSIVNAYTTLMFGYLVNYAVPRLGELVRCISMSKKENKSTTVLFGTVMAERLVDLILLVLTLVFTFVFNYNSISTFFTENIFGPMWSVVEERFFRNEKMTAITIGLLAFGLFFLIRYLNKSSNQPTEDSQDKLDKMLNETWSGVMAINKLENKFIFIVYSIGIWFCYFMTSFLWLLAFPELENFGIREAISIFAISTVARSVPIQGGAMGAYHYLVGQGLALFGAGAVVSSAYAILNHGSSAIFQIIVGVISSIILAFTKDKNNNMKKVNNENLVYS